MTHKYFTSVSLPMIEKIHRVFIRSENWGKHGSLFRNPVAEYR